MKYFRYSILAFVLVIQSPAFGAESPARTVESFYAWAIHPAPEDQGKGLSPARPFFSQELLAALEAQRTYEKSCARLVPVNIKPYMLDQSPFFREKRRWVILDIEWQDGGSLTKRLVDFASHRCAP